MREKQKKELIKIRGEFPEGLLQWIFSPEADITEEVEEAINRVLRDRKMRSQVFLSALARKHIERLVFLIGRLPLVEEELFRKERISVARTADLIRLLGTVGAQVEEAAEFLRVFVTDDELKTDAKAPEPKSKKVEVEEITQEEKEAVREVTTEGRQRIRRILQRLLVATSHGTEEDEESRLLGPEHSEGT